MLARFIRRASTHASSNNFLSYEIHDSPGTHKCLYILHGLLGTGRNWRSMSQNLRKALGTDTWRVVAVDLRGHGKSRDVGKGSSHDVRSAAKDVEALAQLRGDTIDCLIGHSLGGKIALEFSKVSAKAPKQVWSLDSVPGTAIGGDVHGVEKVLQAVQQLPQRIPSRRALATLLAPYNFSIELVDWLGSNLQNVGDELEFVFDINVATKLYDSYHTTDSWPALEAPVSEMFVVKAARSARWKPECLERLNRAPQDRVKFLELENAGHWVHSDNPRGLLEMLQTHISKI
jgi:pimeloyl-ACP methyl ester carboxylesterase